MELDPPSSPTLSLKNRFLDYRLSELSELEGGAVKKVKGYVYCIAKLRDMYTV
jgi:hypothetical protein